MSQDGNYGKTNYLKILLQQYSECWADVRNYTTSIWQIPLVLTAVITFTGMLYGQYLKNNPGGRILTLALALGFTSVSMIALEKHRFFQKARVEDLKEIQGHLKQLREEFEFIEIKWRTNELIEDTRYKGIICCTCKTIAYNWQRGLVISIFIGIVILLLCELCRIPLWYCRAVKGYR